MGTPSTPERFRISGALVDPKVMSCEGDEPFRVVPPPLLNFAGFCNRCGQQACKDPACVAWYRDSRWAICDRCGGLGSDGYGTSCDCFGGVMQVGILATGAVSPSC